MKNILLVLCLGILCFSSCREDVNERDVVIIQEGPEVNVVSSMRGVVLNENDVPVSSLQELAKKCSN